MISHSLKSRIISVFVAAAISASFLTSCGKITASVTIPSSSSSVTYEKGITLPLNSNSGSGTTELYFPRAGANAQAQLIKIINSTQKSLDMAIYSLTDKPVASAVTAAHSRGVAVRIISDKEQSGGQYQKGLLRSFVKVGIPVKINSHAGLMHLKVTIADRKTVTTGSFNYTKSAQEKNDEVFVVLNDENSAQKFEDEFSQMWSNNLHYTNFK